MRALLARFMVAPALGNKLARVLAGHFTSTEGGALAAFSLQQTPRVGVAATVLPALTPWLKIDGRRPVSQRGRKRV